MKIKIVFSLLLIANLLNAQTDNTDVNRFIVFFKSQITKYPVGKIEEHYDQGYFKTLSESEYFDKNVEVGITTVYERCSEKGETAMQQEIKNFFEQHKALKIERKEIASKMNDFNFIKPYLKIKIYSDELKPQYANHGILKASYKGLIEVVVLDLPSGIGSLEKKYVGIWKKSEDEIFKLGKENTLKNLDQKFEKVESGKNGEEFYLLANDTDLFITSSIIDLKKTNPPVGKYGTFISIPNNTVIMALPLNDKEKINLFCLSFMDMTNYLFESSDTKPVSSNLFWLNGNEILLIDKDFKNKKLIYPNQLQSFVGN